MERRLGMGSKSEEIVRAMLRSLDFILLEIEVMEAF